MLPVAPLRPPYTLIAYHIFQSVSGYKNNEYSCKNRKMADNTIFITRSVMRLNILFVCYENICRSPMAEGAFRRYAAERGYDRWFSVSSAGTNCFQKGASPDDRAVAVAGAVGIDISHYRANGVEEFDLHAFDWIFVMDHENFEGIGKLAGYGEKPKVRLVMSFVPGRAHEEIPDPYYGTERDFMRVMDDLLLASAHMLPHLAESCSLPGMDDAGGEG